MSIAAKKAQQQKKGKESIFFVSGLVCAIVAGLIALILLVIMDKDPDHLSMTPILYYLTLSGLLFGAGSYIRENREKSIETLRNLMISLIIIGIVGGAVIGSYIW
jgi:MFS family permease